MRPASSYRVRRATSADIGGVLRCLQEAFEPYREDYTAAAFEDTVPGLSGIEKRLTTMMCFVAIESNGEIVGTISAQFLNRTEGHLRGMAVRPAWQGTEVAALLLSEAVEALCSADCREVTLDTTRPLARAIRFYERHGFVATGGVQDFFGMPLFEYRKVVASAEDHER